MIFGEVLAGSTPVPSLHDHSLFYKFLRIIHPYTEVQKFDFNCECGWGGLVLFSIIKEERNSTSMWQLVEAINWHEMRMVGIQVVVIESNNTYALGECLIFTVSLP